MIKIDTTAIGALRDRLLEAGGAPSVMLTEDVAMRAAQPHPMEGDDEAIALFEAVFDAMYVMVAADGVIGETEKDALRGAIRELTAGAVRSATIDAMCVEAAASIKEHGAKARLEWAAKKLKPHRVAAEAGFVMAAAMAFADNEIADEENETLNQFAELLEIDTDRANELLDELETSDD